MILNSISKVVTGYHGLVDITSITLTLDMLVLLVKKLIKFKSKDTDSMLPLLMLKSKKKFKNNNNKKNNKKNSHKYLIYIYI